MIKLLKLIISIPFGAIIGFGTTITFSLLIAILIAIFDFMFGTNVLSIALKSNISLIVFRVFFVLFSIVGIGTMYDDDILNES